MSDPAALQPLTRVIEPPALALEPPALAMVWHGVGAPLAAQRVQTVVLAPGDALVAIELATICGSDVHTVRGRRPSPKPMVLGHEQIGRVVASDGAVAVDGSPLEPGDRVIWSVTVSCGECRRCRRWLSQKCERLVKFGHEPVRPEWTLSGGFASHAHLPRGTAIVRVPDDADAAAMAPVACASSTAWAAVEALGEIRERDVLVLGAGLVGLSAAAIAADRGAHVTIADPDQVRRDRARMFGVSVALAEPGDARFDGVVEASGAPRAVEGALAAAAIGGVVALVGSVSPGPAVALDPEAVVRGHLTIRGIHNYAPEHLAAAAAWMAGHPRQALFAGLVSATVPLADLDRGMELVGDHVRVGVRP